YVQVTISESTVGLVEFGDGRGLVGLQLRDRPLQQSGGLGCRAGLLGDGNAGKPKSRAKQRRSESNCRTPIHDRPHVFVRKGRPPGKQPAPLSAGSPRRASARASNPGSRVGSLLPPIE